VGQQEEDSDRFETVLAATVDYVGKEPMVLAHLEQYFSPQPASLAKGLDHRLNILATQLGGPPRLIFRGIDEPKPRYDMYPAAALHEVIAMFHRARRSVTRAQMSLIGGSLLRKKPEVIVIPSEGGVRDAFLNAVEEAFWELAEIAYIRLASYWDRVGQLLDFAFFGIRQFERDGVTAVVDRVQNNLVDVDTTLRALPAWQSLRAFQTSENEDGLKWLLRRRNLLIHRLYLRPIQEPEGQEVFDSEFNHLDKVLRKKLAPGTPQEELDRMHWQLQKAAELFPLVIELCEHAANVRHNRCG
jgi:hypothetical protein